MMMELVDVERMNPPSLTETPSQQTTLFIVDDEEILRKSLSRLCISAGFQVECFNSASEFLARDNFPDMGCVLLDYQMPQVNGIEMQAQMSKLHISMPVIFLTGQADIPTSVLAMKQGAVDFLTKPIDESLLFPAIEQAIARHQSQNSLVHARQAIRNRLDRLSLREEQVLRLVITGRLNKQIAYELGIAEKTVKVHRSRVMEKMEATTIAHLVHLCDNAGLDFNEL